MLKRILSLLLVLTLMLALALPALAANGITDMGLAIDSEDDPIWPTFKKYTKKVRYDEGAFVFNGAPTTYRSLLIFNEKRGEQLAYHRFKSESDARTVYGMINGYGLVYKGRLAYPDGKQPYTYYVNAESMRMLVYSGVSTTVNKLAKSIGYEPWGGYFYDGKILHYGGVDTETKTLAPNSAATPNTLTKLLRLTNTVCTGLVMSAKASSQAGYTDYTVTVGANVKNASGYNGQLTVTAMTGALIVDKYYVMFLKTSADGKITLADPIGQSVLEIGHRDTVMPRLNYGIKKLQTSTKLVTSLKRNGIVKRMKIG